jgi:predicted RNase H-like HicB family nuclease
MTIEKGEDGYLISNVVELPGCHTQAKTMSELIQRTKEAIQLYLTCKPVDIATKYVGTQKIVVEA